jgi:hypothetical protein
MRRSYQVTIGRVMLCVSFLSLYFSSIANAHRGQPLQFGLLTGVLVIWGSSRKHLRQTFGLKSGAQGEFRQLVDRETVKGYWAQTAGNWVEVHLVPLERSHMSRGWPWHWCQSVIAKSIDGRRRLFRRVGWRTVPLDCQNPSSFLIRHRFHGVCLILPAPGTRIAATLH